MDIRNFGSLITKLINGENLSREESYNAFSVILNNKTTEMQQGAFLAALAAKGETKEEIAGCWESIYENDTVKVFPKVSGPIVENCGTGMDTFKTFNISTSASIIAASEGVQMARHGARAITSKCGTVDIAEALGVDVECDANLAAESLEKSGIALFNGMSPNIHPRALGRILSQISFGSTLNIAASLASPVKADIGVRGVYSKDLIKPVAEVMREIGYKRAIVMHGIIENTQKGIDEASVSGTTFCAELKEDGSINEFSFNPENMGITTHSPEPLASSGDLHKESHDFIKLLTGNESKERTDAAALNAGLIFYATDTTRSIKEGYEKAQNILKTENAINKLEEWISSQNSNPENGLSKFNQLRAN